jgi:N-carbamoylputrescine amidase
VASFGDKDEGVLVASFDLDAIARYRAEWGFFRDRRTDLYAKSIL